jgi:hypothetical protein
LTEKLETKGPNGDVYQQKDILKSEDAAPEIRKSVEQNQRTNEPEERPITESQEVLENYQDEIS